MSEKQPEALRLADALDNGYTFESQPMVVYGWADDCPAWDAAAELRRLHAECEELRVDALRWRVMRESLIAIDFAWNSPPMSVAIFENHSNECFAGPECADAIADAALARNKEQSNG